MVFVLSGSVGHPSSVYQWYASEVEGQNWNFFFSGAPAARRAAKRSPIIIEKGTTRMHRNGNPCNSFLMVKMASGMDHGRVRPTTTTTNDVAQHGGHPANTKLCSLGLQHISLMLDMHIMCNWQLSYQEIRWPVSRDHIAGSGLGPSRSCVVLKLTADQVPVFVQIAGSCQHNLLKTGLDCSEAG